MEGVTINRSDSYYDENLMVKNRNRRVGDVLTNYIHPLASLGAGCEIGFFSVVGKNVTISSGVHIGNCVTIHPGSVIRENCVIGDNCVIGKQPHPGATSRWRNDDDLRPPVIGRGCVLGSGVVLYAGLTMDQEVMVGDLASVRERCAISRRVIVGRGVALENDVVVGENAKIQTGAYLTAHTVVGAGAFIAPMVITTNDNRMGRDEDSSCRLSGPRIDKNARVGAGALLLPGVAIAPETFVAAGSLVTGDTRPGAVFMGRPARYVRPVPEVEKR